MVLPPQKKGVSYDTFRKGSEGKILKSRSEGFARVLVRRQMVVCLLYDQAMAVLSEAFHIVLKIVLRAFENGGYEKVVERVLPVLGGGHMYDKTQEVQHYVRLIGVLKLHKKSAHFEEVLLTLVEEGIHNALLKKSSGTVGVGGEPKEKEASVPPKLVRRGADTLQVLDYVLKTPSPFFVSEFGPGKYTIEFFECFRFHLGVEGRHTLLTSPNDFPVIKDFVLKNLAVVTSSFVVRHGAGVGSRILLLLVFISSVCVV